MPSYSVAATKDNLSSLIDKALAGEEVIITRHGKPMVALHAVPEARSAVRSNAEAMARLAVLRAGRRIAPFDTAALVREMRDEGAH